MTDADGTEHTLLFKCRYSLYYSDHCIGVGTRGAEGAIAPPIFLANQYS